MREFLNYILQAYELQGIDELASHRISDFLQIRYGGTNEARRVPGSIPEIRGRSSIVSGTFLRLMGRCTPIARRHNLRKRTCANC